MAEVSHSYPVRGEESLKGAAILCYVLYLVGWPTVHIATLVGLVLAYVQRGEARGTLWDSHFNNLIHTFWVALAVAVVAIPLCFVFIGIPILFAAGLWVLFRTVKGLIRAIEGRPYL